MPTAKEKEYVQDNPSPRGCCGAKVNSQQQAISQRASPTGTPPQKPKPRGLDAIRKIILPGVMHAQSEPDLAHALTAKKEGQKMAKVLIMPQTKPVKSGNTSRSQSHSEADSSSGSSSPDHMMRTAIDNGQLFFFPTKSSGYHTDDDLKTPKVSCAGEKQPLSWSASMDESPTRKRSNSICTLKELGKIEQTDGLWHRATTSGRSERANSLFFPQTLFEPRASLQLGSDLKKKGLFSRTKKTIESFDELAKEAKDIMGFVHKDLTKLTRTTHDTLGIAQRTATCLNQILGDHFIAKPEKQVQNLPDTLRAITEATSHCTTCAVTIQEMVSNAALQTLVLQTLPQLAKATEQTLTLANQAAAKLDKKGQEALTIICTTTQTLSDFVVPYLLLICTMVGLAAFEALMPREGKLIKSTCELLFFVMMCTLIYGIVGKRFQ